MRRRMLRAEVDRVVGDGLIARGIGGIDRIAFEQVAAVMIDVRGVGHASPPFGLRGARGFGGAFSAFFVAGVFAFEAVVAFAPSRLVFAAFRSEEHTSELQSLMRISYDVFCLKKKTTTQHLLTHN